MRWSYGWNAVACSVVYQGLCLGTLIYGTAMLLLPWTQEFGVPRSELLAVGMFWQIGMALASPLVGRVIDAVPIRWLVLAGLAVFALTLLAVARADAVWQLIAAYALFMAPAALLGGALTAQSLAAKWFDSRRGLAIGIASLGTSFGGLVVPPLLAWLFDRHGWRTTLDLYAIGVLLVLMPVVALVLAREPPVAAAPQSSVAAASGRIWTGAEVLRSVSFWVPVTAISLLAMTTNGVQINLAAHARDSGHSTAQAASLLSVLSVAMVAGKLLCGAFADRVPHRAMYWVAGLAYIGAVGVLLVSASMPALMLGASLCGFAAGAVQPLLGATLAAAFGPASFGRVIGLAYLFINVSAFGPIIAAGFFDRTGSYSGAFVAFAATTALAMALMLSHRPGPARAGRVATATR